MDIIVYGMVYLGSALMIHNIYGFIRFARYIKSHSKWDNSAILYIPIVLLALFLIGYVAVGVFGNPDLIVSGILFGGSIFVFIMYRLLTRITKRIVESERLEAKLMAAEESNKAKTSFLSTISHEMRTPMNVILGLDTIALKEPNIPDKVRSNLEKIGFSAKHLLDMINKIIDINLLESGGLAVKKKRFSLKDTVDEVSAIIGTMCGDKGLTYKVNGFEDGFYYGDDTLIRQALIGILDNAVKYTEAPGTVELTVNEDEDKDGIRNVTFTVRDTGIGIDKEFLPKIFDAFSREDQSSTSRYGGSGIGLTVTKKTVELLGGTISAESEKNVGSVFTVSIPLEVSDKTEPSEEEADEVSLEGKRILIVEDIPENAEIVADLLELEGAMSEHAENGQIAVDMFLKSEPGYYDTILMDLRMPVMDGLTAARRIRELDRPDAKTVPIIALTANAFESDIEMTFEAGMNAHLAKPADSKLLYSAIRQQLRMTTLKGEQAS